MAWGKLNCRIHRSQVARVRGRKWAPPGGGSPKSWDFELGMEPYDETDTTPVVTRVNLSEAADEFLGPLETILSNYAWFFMPKEPATSTQKPFRKMLCRATCSEPFLPGLCWVAHQVIIERGRKLMNMRACSGRHCN